MKRVAVMQSNYIPWKGYFDMIAAVDEFILFDEMQYTRRDWRNRNKIKTAQGLQWLTVPVRSRGKYTQTISETEINGSDWVEKHWKALELSYRRAPHWDSVAAWLRPLYFDVEYLWLSQMNQLFLQRCCDQLSIKTKISRSEEYELAEGKSERLADLCIQAGADEYVSGPAARSYIDEDIFVARNLKLRWFDYDCYPEYPQLWGAFEHGVTILDLFFNCGPEAPAYLKELRS
jgi:hypothetical protein